MKPKSLIILAFIAATLLSYIYFEIEKPAKQKQLGGGKEDLLSIGNLSSIQSIKVTTATKTLSLQRETIGWRITSPVKDLASQSKVENLISALGKFKKMRVLYPPAQANIDLTQYGLKPPKVLLEYKTSDIVEPVVLELGNQSPGGSSTYAKTKAEGIVLGTMELDFLSTQSPDDFREMRFTTVAASEFEEVFIEYNKTKMRFKKEGEQWSMLQPFNLPIDQDFTKSFMDKIGFVRANQFVVGTPPVLQKPDIRILVGFKKDVKDLRTTDSDAHPQGFELLISKSKKGKEFEYFAKADKTLASTVAQFHYDNFTKPPEDFIKKTFDNFLNADVQKLTVSKLKKPEVVIVKSDKDFSVTSGKESFSAPSEKVEKILDLLRNMRASKFIQIAKVTPKLGSLTVSLELKDKGNISYTFDFQKDVTLLWSKEGMKFAMAKDAISTKDFDLEAFKPALQPSPAPTKPVKKAP